MISLFRFSALLVSVIVVGACQQRIQPIYVPSEIAIPASLNETPLSVIGEGIIVAGESKKWKMQELEPGVVRGTLDVRGKHQAVVDVKFDNRQYAINYVSSADLLNEGARIHYAYNTWVRELETSINSSLDNIATRVQTGQLTTTPQAPSQAVVAADATAPTTDADIAWKAIKNQQDPAELGQFLKGHMDSKYAAVAIQNLNAALAISSTPGARNSTGNDYDATGRWRISTQYEAVSGKSAYCAKLRVWDFDLTLSNTPQSYTFWTGTESLYVDSTIEDGQIVLALNYPSGGSNWQWREKFTLDQDQKNFLSEAQESGGGHANCVGRLVLTMIRIK